MNNKGVFFLQESGYTIQVGGTPKTVFGALVIVTADNPASAAVGGFKKGAKAYRHCRQCLGTSTETVQKVGY